MIIVSATDEAYAPHAATMIHSVWHNNRSARFFLIGDRLSPEARGGFERLAQTHGIDITLVDLDGRLLEGVAHADCPMSSYAKILAADLVPADTRRVLYLDADCLVLGDLTPLYTLDMQGMLAAGCSDPGATMAEIVRDGTVAPRQYLNAGVLLFDLANWRQEGVTQRALDVARHHRARMRFHDQCAINVTLDGRTLSVSNAWNFMAQVVGKLPSGEPLRIVHFGGLEKPWRYAGGPFNEIYWLHRRHTGFDGSLPKTAPKFLQTSRLVAGLLWLRPKYVNRFLNMRRYHTEIIAPYLSRNRALAQGASKT